MNITLRPFDKQDMELLSAIMVQAFDEDAIMHRGIKCGPEGYDDGSFLRKFALHADATSYTILQDEIPVGLVILWLNQTTHENFLGCLFTKPELHSQGIGNEVWQRIEAMYPKTRVWRTETPLCSTRNLHFYVNKCGFMIYRIENPQNRDEAQVKLVKYMDDSRKESGTHRK